MRILATCLLLACAKKEASQAVADDPATETARLHAWLDQAFEEKLSFTPMAKSYLGLKDDDHRRIDDLSEAGEDALLAWMQTSADAMRDAFDRDALTPTGQLSYDLWLYEVERKAAERPFRRNHFRFEQMAGQQSELPTFLINIHDVSEPADVDAYISRITEVGRAIDQLRTICEDAAADGVHMPDFAYAGSIEQSQRVVSGAPFSDGDDAALWADLKAEIATLVEAGSIDDTKAEAFRSRARAALVDDLLPAYERLIKWLEADRAHAVRPVLVGAKHLPNGEAFYRERLAFNTTTDLSADAIHELGRQEVARILLEMETVKAEAGFKGTLQDYFEHLRTHESQFFPNTDEGRQGYIDAVKANLARINAQLPSYFGVLPKADVVVKRVEPFREFDGGAQHYVQATPDGSRPGTYYIHLSDMTAMPKSQLESIAYHEANPGHHMQSSIAQEVEDTPRFRTQIWYSAYGEGWALYSEKLAKEMGGYEDPVSDFGRLSTEMWRALRLVVDTGLHSQGWTEDQAVAYMMAHSPEPETSVRSEVRRYIVWPGQATSYKVGMLKLQELRARAEQALGEQFDIRAFHDLVLTGGAMPLTMLEARVDRWTRR